MHSGLQDMISFMSAKSPSPAANLWIVLLFSNHSAVKREQIIFTLETMKRDENQE